MGADWGWEPQGGPNEVSVTSIRVDGDGQWAQPELWDWSTSTLYIKEACYIFSFAFSLVDLLNYPVNSMGKVVLALIFSLTAAENGSITAQGSECNINNTTETRSLYKSPCLCISYLLFQNGIRAGPMVESIWQQILQYIRGPVSQAYIWGMRRKRKGSASVQQVERKMTDEMKFSVWEGNLFLPRLLRKGERRRITTWVWV